MVGKEVSGDMIAVRSAAAGDGAAIAAIVHAAFAASALGHHGEAELVRRLTDDGAVVVSLLAWDRGEPVGHALFSAMDVQADGVRWRGAALAPVAVLPHLQGRGIGAALIKAGLAQLAVEGVQICFVLGHPAYYPRFGFSAAVATPFASPYAGPHFMALLLDKSLQIPKSGRADYAAAFSR